jgi:hypothetical protein
MQLAAWTGRILSNTVEMSRPVTRPCWEQLFGGVGQDEHSSALPRRVSRGERRPQLKLIEFRAEDRDLAVDLRCYAWHGLDMLNQRGDIEIAMAKQVAAKN